MPEEPSELIKELAAFRSQAAEITSRIRRDADLLVGTHHEFAAALSRVIRLCAAATTSSSRTTTTSSAAPSPLRALRIAEVSQRVGLGRSSVWRMVKDGEFPKPRQLTSHAVGWLESEVEDWLMNRPVVGDQSGPIARRQRRHGAGRLSG